MNIKLTLRQFQEDGIFSRFMMMLPHAWAYDNVEHLYFDFINDNSIYENQFNWVFDQYCDDSFINFDCFHFGTYAKDGMPGRPAIEIAPEFHKLRTLCSKVVIRKEIMEEVARYSSLIDENTLGVHVRLGEMNVRHPLFGVATTETYINRIKEINPSSIFLASDNDESIIKIKETVSCRVIVINNFKREKIENIQYDNVHINLIHDRRYWQEVFVDCLLLSRCKELLCRVSNFANASILFSDTITKIHRL